MFSHLPPQQCQRLQLQPLLCCLAFAVSTELRIFPLANSSDPGGRVVVRFPLGLALSHLHGLLVRMNAASESKVLLLAPRDLVAMGRMSENRCAWIWCVAHSTQRRYSGSGGPSLS